MIVEKKVLKIQRISVKILLRVENYVCYMPTRRNRRHILSSDAVDLIDYF